jgi:hypothetical protein
MALPKEFHLPQFQPRSGGMGKPGTAVPVKAIKPNRVRFSGRHLAANLHRNETIELEMNCHAGKNFSTAFHRLPMLIVTNNLDRGNRKPILGSCVIGFNRRQKQNRKIRALTPYSKRFCR